MILLNKFLSNRKIRIYSDADKKIYMGLQLFFVEFIKGPPCTMYRYIITYKKYELSTLMNSRYNVWRMVRFHVGVYINFSSNMSIIVGTRYLSLKSKDYSGSFKDFIDKIINTYKASLSI